MPYKVSKHASCPTSKPHAVVKEDGSLVPGGCHEKREDALKHQRALQTNVESEFQRRLEADFAGGEDSRAVLEQIVKGE